MALVAHEEVDVVARLEELGESAVKALHAVSGFPQRWHNQVAQWLAEKEKAK